MPSIIYLKGERIMATTITLYNIDKRRNSTKQPTQDNIVSTVTGRFIVPSSMFSPTIVLNVSANQRIGTFNYLGIAWPTDVVARRYYWVVDKVVSENGQIIVTAVEDAFGTFKQNIYNSVQYVLRSNTVLNDNYVDSTAPTKLVPAIRKVNLDSPFDIYQAGDTDSINKGFFVIGCIAEEVVPAEEGVTFGTLVPEIDNIVEGGIIYAGVNSSSDRTKVKKVKAALSQSTESFTRGSVRYYTFSPREANTFFQMLANIKNIAADFNIADHFVSCVYCPFSLDANQQTPVDTVFLFGADGSLPAEDEATGAFQNTQTLLMFRGRSKVTVIPKGLFSWSSSTLTLQPHQQYDANITGNFINFAPYHNIKLAFGPFGELELSAAEVRVNNFDISLNIQCDLVEGLGSLRVIRSPGDYVVNEVKTALCPHIPLVSITSNSYLKEFQAKHDQASALISSGLAMMGTAGHFGSKYSNNIASQKAVNAADMERALANASDVGRTYNTMSAFQAGSVKGGWQAPAGAAAAGVATAMATNVELAYKEKLSGYVASIPTPRMTGSNGSLVGFVESTDFALIYVDYLVYDNFKEFINSHGATTYKYCLLSDLASNEMFNVGFVICENAQLVSYTKYGTSFDFTSPSNTPALGVSLEEQSVICNQLNSGIYLE